MNRNEMEHMLSLVDEKYIAELCDSEETTSEVTPVRTSRRHIAAWAAAAAVLCIGIAGGGLLLGERLSLTGPTVSVADSEMKNYELVWQTEALNAIYCYTLEAGGESRDFNNCRMPFESEAIRYSGTVYCDKSGNPVNAFFRYTLNDTQQILVTLCDDGTLLPEECDIDLTKGADSGKPVIHIYEATHWYELYYVHNGVGMSMQAYCTPEEAAAFAAALLEHGISAAYVAENSSEGRLTDRGDYLLVWGDLEGYTDTTVSIDLDGPEYGLQTITMPFDTLAFSSYSGRIYCDTDGTPVNAAITFGNDVGTLSIKISDRGDYFTDCEVSCPELENVADKPIILIYPVEFTDSTSAKDLYEMRFERDGTAFTVKAYGTPEEAEAYAAALLHSDLTVETLCTDDAVTEDLDSLYFSGDISAITRHRRDASYEVGGGHIRAEGSTIPFSPDPFTDAVTEIYFTEDGTPGNAHVVMTGENGMYADIFINGSGDMMSEFPTTGTSAGRPLNGILLYGFRSAEDEDYRELYFCAESIGCSLLCDGMTEAQILQLAKALMIERITPASLYEGIREQTPDDPA